MRRLARLTLLLAIAGLIIGSARAGPLPSPPPEGLPGFAPVMKAQIVPDKPYATFREVYAEAIAVNERAGLVYVATSDGSLSIVDWQGRNPIKLVVPQPGPRGGRRMAIDSEKNLVYMAHGGGAGGPRLVVLDGTTLQEVSNIDGLLPEPVNASYIRDMVPDFERDLVYLLYEYRGSGFQSLGRLVLVDLKALSQITSLPTWPDASHLALDKQRGLLYVLDVFRARKEIALMVLRADDLGPVAEYPLPAGAWALALGPGGDRLYTFDSPSKLLMIDADSGAVLAERATQAPVHDGKIFIDEKGGRLLATVGVSGSTTKLGAFSLASLEPQGEIEVRDGSPVAWAVLGGTRPMLVATQSGVVTIIDVAQRMVLGQVALSPRFAGLAYDPALRRAFILSRNESKLLAVDLPNGNARGIPLPPEPREIQADPSRHLLYLLTDRGREVTVVDTRSLTVSRRISLALDWAASTLAVDTQRNRIFLASYREIAALEEESGRVLAIHQRPQHWAGPIALAVDDKTGDLYTRHGDGLERFKGDDLKPAGKLADYAVTVTLDPQHRRAYLGEQCYAKWCGSRSYVYDLDSGRRLAKLEDVYGIAGINPGLGHLYIPGAYGITIVDSRTFDRAFTRAPADFLAVDSTLNEVLALRKEEGTLTLYRDSLALSSPETARLYPARIEILWPHGGARTQDANLANLSAMVFKPGTLDPVDEKWQPALELWASVNNSPARPVATGKRRVARDGYPIWDFNDVDVSPARNEETTMMFFLRSSANDIASSIWSHGVDGKTRFPRPPSPTGLGTSRELDTVIRIVWPHDGRGDPAGVLEADYVNIAVSVLAHGANLSVPPDWGGQVKLYRALNNGTLQLVGGSTKRLVKEGSLTYPVWDFNDVDVSQARAPQTKYYFLAMVEGVPTYPGVWSHGYDARTILPQPDFPLR